MSKVAEKLRMRKGRDIKETEEKEREIEDREREEGRESFIHQNHSSII